ncbi:MAG: hypothetical protein AAFP69_19825, partial [Planctomycetota bacterium]
MLLRSLAGSLAIPALGSLSANAIGNDAPVTATKGAGTGARRFVAVGNLLGFQCEDLFLDSDQQSFADKPLLQPLEENHDRIT